MNENEKIETLVLNSLDTAKGMLKEYKTVVPFGARAFNNGNDIKMNCPKQTHPKANMKELVDLVIEEFKGFLKEEDMFATALVTCLEADSDTGIGIQIETNASAVLFVYPYKQDGDDWKIGEPEQTIQLIAPRVFNP